MGQGGGRKVLGWAHDERHLRASFMGWLKGFWIVLSCIMQDCTSEGMKTLELDIHLYQSNIRIFLFAPRLCGLMGRKCGCGLDSNHDA